MSQDVHYREKFCEAIALIHCLYHFISIDMLQRSLGQTAKSDDRVRRKYEHGHATHDDSPLNKPVHQPLFALHFYILALIKAVFPGQFLT